MNTEWKKYVLLSALAIASIMQGRAQDCAEDPTLKTGIWKKDPDKNYYAPTVHPATLKNKAAISTVLDSIASVFIQSNPQPVGSYAKWYKYFTTDWDSVTSPDLSFTNYQFISLFLPYICEKGVVKPFSLTDTWLYVHVNGFWPSGHTLQHEINERLGENLYTLPPQRGSLGGYPVFEPVPKGEKDDPWLIFYSVLIHRPGQLPYVPLTKREFFQINRRLIAGMEKEYQAGVARQRKNMGEDWYRERTEKIKEQFDGIRNNLDQLEKLYAGEMDQPAILRTWEWTIRNLEIANPAQKNLFTTANRGYQLVRSNPGYMDPRQPKWKPQFMWVEWYKVVSKPNSLAMDKAMHEKVDFTRLGALLAH